MAKVTVSSIIHDFLRAADAAAARTVLNAAEAGAGGGATQSIETNQAGHGFSVGELIRPTGANTYAKAQADSESNADVVSIVTAVADVDNFTHSLPGLIEAGVPAEDPGTVMFLSAATAGALVTTAPSTAGQVNKPVLFILESGARAIFANMRGFVVPDPQAQFDEQVQALGNISGATDIDLSSGTAVTATLTGAVTLSFASEGRPASGKVRNFSLKFTNIEDITWPAGTLFVGDAAPTALGTVYEFPCQIDSAGVVTALGLLDNIGDAT